MYANQVAVYTDIHKESLSGRDLESSVLTRAALMLKNCQDHWNAVDHEEQLSKAIKFHQQIWSIFQAELASPDNLLPRELRQDILSLSLFMDKRLFEVMAYPTPEKLTAIININLNLAAGLNAVPVSR